MIEARTKEEDIKKISLFSIYYNGTILTFGSRGEFPEIIKLVDEYRL
jgi:hypothetical protein